MIFALRGAAAYHAFEAALARRPARGGRPGRVRPDRRWDGRGVSLSYERTDEQRDELVEQVAREIQLRGLTGPAVHFLEASRPYRPLGANAMLFFDPVLRGLFGGEDASASRSWPTTPASSCSSRGSRRSTKRSPGTPDRRVGAGRRRGRRPRRGARVAWPGDRSSAFLAVDLGAATTSVALIGRLAHRWRLLGSLALPRPGDVDAMGTELSGGVLAADPGPRGRARPQPARRPDRAGDDRRRPAASDRPQRASAGTRGGRGSRIGRSAARRGRPQHRLADPWLPRRDRRRRSR